MTNKEYEKKAGLRVSEIVKLAIGDFDSIVKYFTIPQEQTDAMRLGLAVHSMLLRTDRESIPDDLAVLDYDSFRTKEAQKAKERAINNGLIPILISQYDRLYNALDNAMPYLDIYFNPKECEFERAFFDKDDKFGAIKGRLDCIDNANDCVNDLKVTTQTNSLDKKIFDSGYQLQMYIYMKLAGLEKSNLVFFNHETSTLHVKSLKLYDIEQECVALLNRAYTNYERLQAYKAGDYAIIECGEYNTPQWALTYLLENENQL